MPLSVVESTAFRDMMTEAQPRFAMPSRKHLSTKLLPQRAANVQMELKLQMSSAEDICLTVDLWSSRDMRSFMGITGHFVVNFSLHSVMLACHRFQGSHTADKIFNAFEETISEFDINTRLSTIVTDNAANMVNAFSLPGMGSLVMIPNDDDANDASDDDDNDDLQEVTVTDEFDFLLPHRTPCFAHTLQLMVKDGLKQAGKMKNVIAKVGNLVSHVRRSTSATDLFDSCTKLQAANKTRWNSQLKMLRSVLKVPQDVLNSLDYSGKPTAYEMKLVSELCEVLLPFEEATDAVQGELVVTSSMVLICIRGLRAEMQRLREIYSSKLITALQASIEKRLAPYEGMDDFKLATMLDPRFKLDWCQNDESRDVRDLLTSQMLRLSPTTPVENNAPTIPEPKRSRLINFMANRAQPSATTQSSSTMEEDSTPLNFWK